MINQVSQYSAVQCAPSPKQPEMVEIYEKIKSLTDQMNIFESQISSVNDRLFGCRPCDPTGKGELKPVSNGSFAANFEQLDLLQKAVNRCAEAFSRLQNIA